MLNLKQVVSSVKSGFNFKNWRKLAGKFTKYQLALLLFFVVSTGVIYVGSITVPGQISPVQASEDKITTENLMGGGEKWVKSSRLNVICESGYPAPDNGGQAGYLLRLEEIESEPQFLRFNSEFQIEKVRNGLQYWIQRANIKEEGFGELVNGMFKF